MRALYLPCRIDVPMNMCLFTTCVTFFSLAFYLSAVGLPLSRYIAYFIVSVFSFSYEYTEPIIHVTLACMMDVLYDGGKCYLSLSLSGSHIFPQTLQ